MTKLYHPKTCVLCNVTAEEGYHFDSHLASDSHRSAKMQADNAALIEALKGLINVCTHPQSTKADMKRIAKESRYALAQVEG